MAEKQLEGVRVLVVEDDESSREVLSFFLKLQGADVLEAADGREALLRFRESPPDTLVSDLMMPEMDGFELIKAVRSLPEESGGATPAVAVSAASRERDALRSGYDVFLAKPLLPQAMVAAIVSLRRSPS